MKLRKIVMGRRGVSQEAIEGMVYFFLTLLVLTGVGFMIQFYMNSTVNTNVLQANVLFYRIMYSPDSISYQDPVTRKVEMGVINLSSFSTEVIERSIQYSYDKKITARLSLLKSSGTGFEHLKTAYINEELFEQLKLRSLNELDSKRPEAHFWNLPVTYVAEDGTIGTGLLKGEVIIPR